MLWLLQIYRAAGRFGRLISVHFTRDGVHSGQSFVCLEFEDFQAAVCIALMLFC
jgi:uncharacterized membrane protein